MKIDQDSSQDQRQDQALITILIPTFNRANLLSRAIKSVQKQSYKNWALIISDNASTDDTASVVAEAMEKDNRISYFCHEHNIGMLANWEFAISKVGSNFFCLLSDDDLILPTFFQKTIAEMLNNKEIGLCFGVTAILEENGLYLGNAPTDMSFGDYPAGSGAVAMVKSQHPASTGTLFRSECVHAVGGFDQRTHYVADLDLMLRVALSYPIKFIDEEVAFHIAHQNNSFKDATSWFPGFPYLLKNIVNQKSHNSLQNKQVIRRLMHNCIFPLIIQYIRYPINTHKSINIRNVTECFQEASQPYYFIFQLPIYILKRLFSLLKRKIDSFSKPIAQLQRHPKADEFFTQ